MFNWEDFYDQNYEKATESLYESGDLCHGKCDCKNCLNLVNKKIEEWFDDLPQDPLGGDSEED